MTITTYTPKPLKRWFYRNRWIVLGVLIIVIAAVVVRLCAAA